MSEDHHFAPGDSIEQRSVVKTGVLWASAIGLITLIVVSMGLMRAFQLALSKGGKHVHPVDADEQVNLINRMAPLDPNQRAHRLDYEKQQAELLRSYGWIDQKQQLVHIPIDQAIALTIKQYGKAE